MNCKFLDSGYADAVTNMAIDEKLLHNCTMPTLRVYGWRPAAISVGSNQNIAADVNVPFCAAHNIPIVRRITGGKAIFHDDEITYSFIVPQRQGLLPNDITASYRVIASALLIALKKIGIAAEIKKQSEKNPTALCFNSTNWYELTAVGKKISGSAQRRMNGNILQHGSILISCDYEKNAALFLTPATAAELQNHITSIFEITGKRPTYAELSHAISEGFREHFGFIELIKLLPAGVFRGHTL